MFWIITISCIVFATILLVLLAIKLNLKMHYGLNGGLIVGACSIVPVFFFCQALHIVSLLSIFLVEVLTILILTIVIILFRFFRDPERSVPIDDTIIISPADGTIRYIHELDNQVIPVSDKKGRNHVLSELIKTDIIKEGSYLIGIEMSVLDNHVNRAPIAGKIIMQQPSKGKFLSLRSIDAIFENERVTTIIENGMHKIAIIQIASRLVRRIVSFHQVDTSVQQGERLGMIRFGSQVDLIIPTYENVEICIEKGEHVKAGETIIARI